MKSFTITKIGYTAGVYGCTGEYFNCTFTNYGKMEAFIFQGMYGVEDRIRAAMIDKGYQFFHTTGSIYGKLTRKDLCKWIKSEQQALDFIKNGLLN